MGCLFCKIANKELVSEIVYENEAATSVLDIHPIAPGHTMVLPKRHADTILDLRDEDIEGVFAAAKQTTAVLQQAFRPDGFTIGINHGSASGQTVDHLHIHIVPRFKGDGGSSVHSVVHNPPKETLEELTRKITDAKALNAKQMLKF